MVNKVLFIVPHEDDELFVGGAMLANLAVNPKYEVYVLIATNGDYNPEDSKIRVKESIDALSVFGIEKNNIIFAGYGDEWKGQHIYHSKEDEVKISFGGFSETYLDNESLDEWHYKRYGTHSKYTRRNYVNDISDVISSISPDTIICVDMDSHADHKAVSLFTDEALKKVLISKKKYHPIYLKKYAYNGNFYGRDDFFKGDYLSTYIQDDYSTKYFNNNNAIRYMVGSLCKTKRIRSNLLFKASKKYKSQKVWMNAGRFINGDIAYWQRYTNNLALDADIRASSGETKWLNDFKLFDTTDVRNKNDCFRELCWKPDRYEKESTLSITLNTPAKVKYLNVYYDIDNIVEDISIQIFDEKKDLISKMISSFDTIGASCKKIVIKEDTNISNIIIRLKNDSSSFIGINEIEVLEEYQEIPFKEYLLGMQSLACKEADYDIIDRFLFDGARYIINHLNVIKNKF